MVEPHCYGVDKDNDLVAVSETRVEYHNAFVGQCRQRSLSVTETDGVIQFHFVTEEDLIVCGHNLSNNCMVLLHVTLIIVCPWSVECKK